MKSRHKLAALIILQHYSNLCANVQPCSNILVKSCCTVLTLKFCLTGELNSAKASFRQTGHLQPSSESAGSALHPHLLFLKTGGGSTVSEPKHQLSMQELQTLADSGSTSEGLLPIQTKTPSPSANTVTSKQQPQGPLGTANVVLGTQDESFQRMASLFTPQNDKAIAKALRILEDNDDEPVSQSLFSSLEEDELLNAVSGPYDTLEPVSAIKPMTHQADHHLYIDPMMSLSWLDEADRQDLHSSIAAAQQTLHNSESLNAGDRPAPPRSVLLSISISVVSNNTTVRRLYSHVLPPNTVPPLPPLS